VELAGEGDVVLPPQRLHDLDLLPRALATIVKILVQANEFHLVPAHADAEAESAFAENIQTGRLFGDQNGLTLRQNQDTGGQADFAGAASQEAEKNKRIMEGFSLVPMR
jgi:hypothetical protein